MRVMNADVILGFAFATGVAAAFNPCGVGLVPAYVGLLTGPGRTHVLRGAGTGAAMTLGLLVLYTVIAAAYGLVAGWLGPALGSIGVALGCGLSLWGAAILWRPNRFAVYFHHRPGARRLQPGLIGAALYGWVYGLASLGCTFPLFLSLLIQAAARGALLGAGMVVAYGVGMGVVLTAVAVLATMARASLPDRLWRLSDRLPRITGALVLASGLLLLAYWLLPQAGAI